jgi:hypothetical protein
VDRRHLKVLQTASQLSRSFRVDVSAPDWPLYEDPWLAGCFEGFPHHDQQHRLDLIEIDRLSAHGAEVRDELYGIWTSVGLWKKHRWQVYAWFFGIVALVLVGVIVYLIRNA